jgi:Ca-activated chloride channel family protein
MSNTAILLRRRYANGRFLLHTSILLLLVNLAACNSATPEKSGSAPTAPATQPQTESAAKVPPSTTTAGLAGNLVGESSVPPTPPVADRDISGGEAYKSIADDQFYAAKDRPLSTFAIDVDPASYSNVRRFINNGQLPPPDAVRIEELINYFPYDYPQPQGKEPFSINTEVAKAPWNPQHQLVQIGLQGKKINTENLPASNLVFLVDVSGSMSAPNKLPLLKESLKLLVNEMRSSDRVAIVAYAGSAGLVLPSTPGNEKNKIIAALDRLESGGSTAGGEGIVQAYKVARENLIKSGNNRVILATDGDFNVGVSSDEELVKLIEKERKSGIFLTILGLGVGNLKDSKMEQLANKGNGNYAYIDSLLEAKKVLVKEFGSTLFTIAKDVKIQVEFNPAKVRAYRLIGYENRVLANRDFNDDKKDAGELGAGHAVTALYEVIPVGVNSNTPLAQPTATTPEDRDTKIQLNSPELMQLRLRYKDPDADKSQLLTTAIGDRSQSIEQSSNNLKFAAAVAAYGMKLRNSPYRGNTSFSSIIDLANRSKGADLDGYRAEFIQLVKQSKNLAINN